eukprot:2620328-Rhodomonas_salina.2
MEGEHLGAKDSDEAFEAFNGELRTTKPADEWRKVLPKGVGGDINTFTYDGKTKLSKNMMKKKARKAKLRKHELVALRLYTGVLIPPTSHRISLPHYKYPSLLLSATHVPA